MQRYHAANCTSAVNNSAIGSSARDTARADLSLNPRRPVQIAPYKLKCDQESLNSRLGPPDFHPPTTNCHEETLNRDYVQGGYKETVDGLEEAREISLSEIQTFTKPIILRCKEAIRKCHRAINESRAQKRKAGQVYGLPLSGTLLTKSGIFPEQKTCSEDFRRKWIESLSQNNKRLRSLADHIPLGYKKRSLLEVLARNNVPLLRATWFIKVTYLNQVRQVSSSLPEKNHALRSEQWTKDVIDYLRYLLEEIVSRNGSHSNLHVRDRSPQMIYSGSVQHKSDSTVAAVNGEEASLHFKWWYVVRILHWHHAEGLLLPSLIIDWVLNQLQEKELLGTLQLLLPIIYGVIESVILCQSYVRSLVGVALRFLREPSPSGSDLVDNSRRAYTVSTLVEMLRYLVLAVPDTFVSLDCFPLPSCMMLNGVSFSSKFINDGRKVKNGMGEIACVFGDKGTEVQSEPLSVDLIVSSIKKRTESLARATRPGHAGYNIAKAVNSLDNALIKGDVEVTYKCLFDNLFYGSVDESWTTEVSSCLYSTLEWIRTVKMSVICSIFFICEWATCDFRDFRTGRPSGLKFTGKKDFTQIYIAVRLLKLKMVDLSGSRTCKHEGTPILNTHKRDPCQMVCSSGRAPADKEVRNSLKQGEVSNKVLSDILESPGPLHDIIVCWIDQHEVKSSEGLKRIQLLIIELVRCGIFYPQSYVRQLIVSGIMDRNGATIDLDKRKRHHKILQQLPSPYIHAALEEAQIAEVSLLSEAMRIYTNERRFLLRGLLDDNFSNVSPWKLKYNAALGLDDTSSPIGQHKRFQSRFFPLSKKNLSGSGELEELKASISVLLQLPYSLPSKSFVGGIDEYQGNMKRPLGLNSYRIDAEEGTPGCEECRRAKRQKLTEERSASLQGCSSNPSDDDEAWWVRKGTKSLESFRVEPPLKPSKHVSRGRQKIVRKTQSLAHLAAARIEGSQGASTSHVCDSRVSCPYHRVGVEGDASKSVDGFRLAHSMDLVSIGKTLRRLRFVEKRTITVWLITLVRHLVEETEKNTTKMSQYNRSFTSVDDESSVRWKLGEDELSSLLYLMDVCDDLVLAARFLLWLLPKVLSSSNSTIHGGRNIRVPPRNVENHVCMVGEGFLLSSIRRYENVLVAADLLPEALMATVHRAAVVMASNGRVFGSASLDYARHLLKRYGRVASVAEWEKNFKETFDKRLVSELESSRSMDGEFGFPLGVPSGVEDLDEFLRQKIGGVHLSRIAGSMKDIVQRNIEDVVHCFYGKERKSFAPGSIKNPALEKSDDVYQIGQQVVMGLMECMRQTGGAAQEGDPMLVSSAVSAIVNSVGLVIGKMSDSTVNSNHLKFSSSSGLLDVARRILRILITCLCLLKEALGERQSRVFEIALATEASSALGHVFTPAKPPRDSNTNLSNENMNTSTKVHGKATRTAASVSALVIGAVIHGVASLERMVTVFRLKEGLDLAQFVRSMRSNSNGNARSIGASKVDNLFEVSVHWFRVLIGNCRGVSDGFIVELLGEPSMVALSRMQRTLPLKLVLPPAYSVFAFVIWKPFILNASVVIREDINQLYQSLTLAINDAIKHRPFRDVCLRDTHGFYDYVAADSTDTEFAAMLHSSSLDLHLKSMAFVPLRARLFLNAIIDCKMPPPVLAQDDWNRMSGQGESKLKGMDNETKLRDKLVQVLDTLQPAKFHWQWVELRLLLNEQALSEKLHAQGSSLTEAIRSLSPNPDNAASDNEGNFIQIILARLLVRPDAAPLFSEVLHLFGRSLEDSMLLQAKWFLGGNDVLYGRKSIRQRLINIAENNGLSTKAQFWKPWGWCHSSLELPPVKGDKRKLEVTSIEEGEVVDEGSDLKHYGKRSTQLLDVEGFFGSQEHTTERAFIELVLPCIDQSSNELRNTFANDLIKQMNDIEQQIGSVTRGSTKQSGIVTPGAEGPVNKGNSRKGMRSGSPEIARPRTETNDLVPPYPPALRASISLRLQFLLRLLPSICADGEPSVRNMRHMLASVILRLLGSRFVHEETEPLFIPTLNCSSKREVRSPTEAASVATVVVSDETLFDRLLSVLHGLLGGCHPCWLLKSGSKPTAESRRDFSVFDRDVAESFQKDLDRMQVPDSIRWRIQTAMPFLIPSFRWSISCQPPSLPPSVLVSLQSNISTLGSTPGISSPSQKNLASLARTASNALGKAKTYSLQQDPEMDVDPWTLLEDGADSGQSSSNTAVIASGEHANIKAPNWLKGAVRVRRTDLTYIGAVDEDS